MVLYGRIQTHYGSRGHKGRIGDGILDWHDKQVALLTSWACLDHESDEPGVLVKHSRPREPFPQLVVVGNTDVNIEGDETVGIACCAGGKQPAPNLLAVA